MKKFCSTHRFYYDTVCPFCTSDKYASKKDSPKKSDPGITMDKIEQLKKHFAG